MRAHPRSPAANQLPPGIDESVLSDAIVASGYPLQGTVAEILTGDFHVTEEWGFIDADTGEHRSLDIYAYRALNDEGEESVRAAMALLIECKRSRHPYVFFQSVPDRPVPGFPSIVGLPRIATEIHQRGKNLLHTVAPARLLGVTELPFVLPGPPRCSAFTKAVPNGKKVELSGTDPFQSLILPLVKAHQYAIQRHPKAESNAKTLFPRLMLAVSVIDAPILLVESPNQAHDPVLVPWVRVVRLEAKKDASVGDGYRFYVVDVVHSDFFREYVSESVLPFGEEFGRRAVTMGPVLFSGGEVTDLQNWQWSDVKPRPMGKAR